MKLHKSIIGGLAAVLVLSGVFGLTAPIPASAATNSTNLTQLKDALELLRGSMLRIRNEHGSSTRSYDDKKIKGATSTRPFMDDDFRRGSSTRATSSKPLDRTCMQEAVNTREEAIMAAFQKFTDSTLAAMEKRQTAFAAVWTESSISNTGKYNGVWTTWKKDTEAARKQLKTDRNSAWKIFNTTAKQTCKATLPKAETEKQETGSTAI